MQAVEIVRSEFRTNECEVRRKRKCAGRSAGHLLLGMIDELTWRASLGGSAGTGSVYDDENYEDALAALN